MIDEKIWIFDFSLWVCSTELYSLVCSLEYLVSNGRQVLMGGIRLDGSAIIYVIINCWRRHEERGSLQFFSLAGEE